jgi:hypothetical protein
MEIYWLGNYVGQLSNNALLSRYCISVIQSTSQFKKILERPILKQTVFFLEINQLTEVKFLELQNWVKLSGEKLKIIVFYQQKEESPLINKMYGKNLLLLSPSDKLNYETLSNRFLRMEKPLFRRWDRVRLNLKAEIKKLNEASSSYQQTQMLNFSSFGAMLSVPKGYLQNKDYVSLVYYSHDHRKITMQSRVAWVEENAAGSLIGVQFISLASAS